MLSKNKRWTQTFWNILIICVMLSFLTTINGSCMVITIHKYVLYYTFVLIVLNNLIENSIALISRGPRWWMVIQLKRPPACQHWGCEFELLSWQHGMSPPIWLIKNVIFFRQKSIAFYGSSWPPWHK